MFSGTKIATALVTVLIMSMMAVPAFAQETPTPTPTPEPEATTTPTPEPDTSTPDVTPTPPPDTSTPDVTPTPPPDTSTPDVTPTPDPDDGSKSTSSKPTPPGQLKRNGLFGDVVAVDVEDDYIIISTKFGNVTVDVGASTQIKSARDGAISLADIQVGDRAGIHLNRSPLPPSDPDVPTPTPTPTPSSPTSDVTPTPTPTATPTIDLLVDPATTTPDATLTPTPTPATTTPDVTPTPTPTPAPVVERSDSFRPVYAHSIKIIPSKATRSHSRTVVIGKCNAPEHARGTMTVLDEDGNEIPLDCSAGESTEEGSDVILLTRGQGKGKSAEVRGSADPDDIDVRLAGFGSLANDERKALLNELKADRVQARETRLQNLENNAPAHAKGKVQKARGKPASTGGDGDGDGGTPGRGNSGNRGGGSNSGGGNSGNRGGGNPNR